jgi:HAD superfamily hydrolase (TIGR01458 family)
MDEFPLFDLSRIEALMFDLDGVLLDGERSMPGAVEAVRAVQKRGLVTRFVTNTTAQPRAKLLEKLKRLGFSLRSEQLFTPAALARRVMARVGTPRYRLLGPPELEEDLGPGRLPLDDKSTPEWVVMGLYTPFYKHDALCTGLRDLLNGSRLMALHANRLWRTERGNELGLGGYVRALEYGAGTEALVIGKPSAAFFEEVLREMGKPRQRAAMVGDDIECDVGGAQQVGIAGILVRTGRFNPHSFSRSEVEPALVVDDVRDLVRRLSAGIDS